MPREPAPDRFSPQGIERERAALMTLAASTRRPSPALDRVLEERFGIVAQPVSEALATLAARTESGQRLVPRLVVLDQLVRLARGRRLPAPGADDALAGDHDALERLLTALVEEGRRAGPPGPHVTADADDADAHDADDAGADADVVAAAGTVHQVLLQLGVGKALVGGDAWGHLVQHAGGALALTPAEVAKPTCDDRRVVTAGGHQAQVVESAFRSSLPVSDLERWADPRTWPSCSLFFTAMKPLGPLAPVTSPHPGWDGVFEEHVRLGNPPLVTPLRFRYRADPGGSWARCDYKLVAATADIVVDEGFLWVGHDPAGPAAQPTLCRCAKVIRFVDPAWQDWTTVACDSFWTELSIAMATACGTLGHDPPSGPPATDGCGDLAGAWAGLTQQTADLWGQWAECVQAALAPPTDGGSAP